MRKSLYAEVSAMTMEFLLENGLVPVILNFYKKEGINKDASELLKEAVKVIVKSPRILTIMFGFNPERYDNDVFAQKFEDYFWALKNDKSLVKESDLGRYHDLLRKIGRISVDRDIDYLFKNYQGEFSERFFSYKEDEEENLGFGIEEVPKSEDSEPKIDEDKIGDLKYSDLKEKVRSLRNERFHISFRNFDEIPESGLTKDLEYEIRKTYDELLYEYMGAKEHNEYALIEDVLDPQIKEIESLYPFVFIEYNRYK